MNASVIYSRLKKAVLKRLPRPGAYSCAVPGLEFFRVDESKRSENCFYKTKIVLMLQGRKRALIGRDEYSYGPGQCLVSGVDVPGTSYVAEGSPEKPALAISLALDMGMVSRLLSEMPTLPVGGGPCRGIAVADADLGMLDAFLRLVRLLDSEGDIPIFAPIIIREIYSRLLVGPLGGHIRGFCTYGTQNNRIMRAVDWLKGNYDKPIKIEELARRANMAPTTFHRHFRKVTSVSPIQYQKNLRLHEGKRLMIAENETVAEAAYAVGYESPTQFSREYKRLFGVSPKRDVSA